MKRRVRAVALIVENLDGAIMVLQEFETKPYLGKYTGMYSIPMETLQPNEPNNEALQRLIREELSGLAGIVVRPERVGIYRIVPGAWASLYLGKFERVVLPETQSSEVGNHSWLDPQAVFSLWLRPGAREMVEDFVAGRWPLVRRHCQPTSPGS